MSNFPVANINGDSIETLLQQHWDVLKQARELKAALSKAAPHGRNYRTQPEGSTGAARQQWLELMAAANLIGDWAEATLGELVRQCNQRHGDQSITVLRQVLR